MTDYSALKKAAEAATPGPWVEVISGVMPRNGLSLVAILAPLPDYKDNSAFIAAANPAAVLGLIAENERLTRNRDMWRDQVEEQARELHSLRINSDLTARAFKAERDQLKAEVEALREEVALDSKIIAERDRLLKLFECPAHGQCVPYAMDQIEALRKDAERYRWLRSQDDYEIAFHEGKYRLFG